MLLAPLAIVVIEFDFAGVGVAHDWIDPASKLNGSTSLFTDKQLCRPMYRVGSFKREQAD